MKKGISLLSVLAGFVALALFGMFSAGEKHVVVVEEKEHLEVENHMLVSANDSLTKENKTLTDKNQALTSQVTKLSESLSHKEVATKKNDLRNSEFMIALHTLEKIVKEELEWISPEALYQALYEKMNRKATNEEFIDAMTDMIKLGLLHHYIKPDPYMKGDKVRVSEVKKLAKEFGE